MLFVGWIYFVFFLLCVTIETVTSDERKDASERQTGNLIRWIPNTLHTASEKELELIRTLEQLSSNSEEIDRNIVVPPGFIGTRGKRNNIQDRPSLNFDMAVRRRRQDVLPGFVAVREKRQDPGFLAVRGRRDDIFSGVVVVRGIGKRNDDSTDFMAIREPRQDVIDPGFMAVRGKRNIDIPNDVNVIKNRKIHF
ncbi:uncharacterized protein LOC111641045 [Centruroides sculpturatus]|uniref:uncharacterized protein LOC111641045 n=1 Tax=Centruroides sculpturatus TaxID=218467 RepID=UPI000C6E5792|nr:uncharacterized protein LOC111641045 [Centruroides sculpturatus]XP_023242919.1 uncharacterized protein LOC111641045 [Centruroides sculpturatus]